jgi:diaminopimelate decarboxylase
MTANLSAASRLLTLDEARKVRELFGTPCYVYDSAGLKAAAEVCLAIPAPFGLTVRYAMKANPSQGVLNLFRELGLHIDASSDYEVERALRSGFHPSAIQLTSQMPSACLEKHVSRGVLFNACSLHQLRAFGEVAPGKEVSVRINPGRGSGSTWRTITGGPQSSFGIWHEYLPEIEKIARDSKLHVTRLHTHIGSGANPTTWKNVTKITLGLAAKLPEIRTVNLGGGFKVGRVPGEPSVDFADVGQHLRSQLVDFSRRYGRSLHLEIEPGTYLVANAGYVVATCVDVVDTGPSGYIFAKLDAGMPEILRPSLYGAQHPIHVLANEREEANVVFVGRCCESGDLLTPEPKKPKNLSERTVLRPRIGDLVVIGGAGAYCAAMAAINYNSYPQAPEVMLDDFGGFRLLRRRQDPTQVWANEV